MKLVKNVSGPVPIKGEILRDSRAIAQPVAWERKTGFEAELGERKSW